MSTLIRIYGRVGHHWPAIALALISAALNAATVLAVPRLLKLFVDRGVSMGDFNFVAMIAVAIVAIAILASLFSFSNLYWAGRVHQLVARDLRTELFAHYQRLSFAYHDRARTGQLVTFATSDVRDVAYLTGIVSVSIFHTFLVITIIAILMFTTDLILALLAIASLPAALHLVGSTARRSGPMFAAGRQEKSRLNTVLQENLTGHRVVRAFGREIEETEKFDRHNRAIQSIYMRLAWLFASRSPLTRAITALGTVAVLWYGGNRIIDGELSLGTLVEFVSYVLILTGVVGYIPWMTGATARAIASGDRVFEVLDTESPVVERSDPISLSSPDGRVAFERVSFVYDREPVLQDVSFVARPGEVIGILGMTGSGKTTLINMIPRFYDVQNGAIRVDGYDVRDLKLESLRQQIGIVLQDTYLFAGTIRENIAYGKTDAPLEEIVAAAKAANAHDFIASTPDGYDSILGERGITLSGGQRQRVAIARALLMDPRILILDDATSSVDIRTEIEIQQALEKLMKGRTTFVIAHRLSSVRQADQIIVLDEGMIVAQGRHEQLVDQSELYRAMLRQQLQISAEASLFSDGKDERVAR